MFCFPFCCFKRRNKVHPADDVEDDSTGERRSETNTVDAELGHAMTCVVWIKKTFSGYMKRLHVPPWSAEFTKPRGGSAMHVDQEREEQDQTDKTQTVTLPPNRREQLMNRGLMNLGNSCYVNSSLQCLFSAESFCTQLSSRLSAWPYEPPANLVSLFVRLWTLRESADRIKKTFILTEFIKEAASTNPDFRVDLQNDAHEFLFHCLRQMEEICRSVYWTGGAAYECPVRSHFGFELTCVITCGGCGYQRSRKEEFNHLALALVPQGSVTDCLKLFFSDETEVEYKCEVCGCNSASFRWAFHTLPRVLVLQLKRFQLSAAGIVKQHDGIHIDRELHLSLSEQSDPGESTSHTHEKGARRLFRLPRVLSPKKKQQLKERKSEASNLSEAVFSYSLVSVLNHTGHSMYFGHYLSDCSSQPDSCWLSCNDKNVSIVTEEQVLQQRQSSAYVLFYGRR